MKAELEKHGLTMLGVNTPPGNAEAGEFGLACVPGREAEFATLFRKALDYVVAIGGRQIHVLAGKLRPEQRPAGETFRRAISCRPPTSRREQDITLLIEPINARDRPGYFLNRVEHAADVIAKAERKNMRIQFDFYHVQIVGGDLIAPLRGASAGDRPCAGRRGALAPGAGRGRGELPRRARHARPARLCGLRRSRIPAARAAPRRVSAGPGPTASRRNSAGKQALPLSPGCHSGLRMVAECCRLAAAVIANLSACGDVRIRRRPRPARPDEPQRLKDALRKARIDTAERTGVVVDLHDAEVARLELLNEALDPLFAEIPAEVDLFDRGISRGETPRLWIDAIAHVAMGRDKRVYRFVQDTRYGRKVLAETVSIPEMVEAVTKYVAQRLIERERALAETARRSLATPAARLLQRRRRRWRAIRAFVFGLFAGFAALIALALAVPGRALAARQHRPARSRRTPSLRCAARDHLAAPGAGRAVDAIEIVAGGIVLAGRRFRRRRHADRRNARRRSVEPHGLAAMVVAVDHELGAVPREHVAQARRRR